MINIIKINSDFFQSRYEGTLGTENREPILEEMVPVPEKAI